MEATDQQPNRRDPRRRLQQGGQPRPLPRERRERPGAVEATVSLDEHLEWKDETDAQRMVQVDEAILTASWEVFNASAGIEVSQSETYSVIEGLQFDVQCDNQGQIIFWLSYDYFETTWSPYETRGAIWVPVEYGNCKITG
ncbi:uncharacterized protein J7T54_005651 [Emericellopsis cladophorae]|uniref:Uncharacterized protein n=1 Tax=Emericellopsis cladophorae TaxID=2686198 RepID=A0A9Q0BFL8_9HYPO|nr:uncharacterized protein J7T54_005651 [Emericellopsis cladophorae]KAI6783622.1 hypothetical protein J7T54_005651 [Emericellopsis cladophorae]